jgi:4-carboxymuconolactone decarboxylase
VAPDAVEAIRRGEPPAFADPAEAMAHELAGTLLARHRLDDALYARARTIFSEAELVELVTVIGYYCLISLTLNAFEAPLLDGMADPFPDAP